MIRGFTLSQLFSETMTWLILGVRTCYYKVISYFSLKLQLERLSILGMNVNWKFYFYSSKTDRLKKMYQYTGCQFLSDNFPLWFPITLLVQSKHFNLSESQLSLQLCVSADWNLGYFDSAAKKLSGRWVQEYDWTNWTTEINLSFIYLLLE